MQSTRFERHGDKANSAWFEEFLPRLLADRDRSGLTEMIHEIDAMMITVEPGCFLPEAQPHDMQPAALPVRQAEQHRAGAFSRWQKGGLYVPPGG